MELVGTDYAGNWPTSRRRLFTAKNNRQKQAKNKNKQTKNQKKRGLRGKPKPLITNPKPQSLSYFRLRSSVSCKLTFITRCRARVLNILSLPSKRFQRDGNFLPSDPVSLLRDCWLHRALTTMVSILLITACERRGLPTSSVLACRSP